MKVKTKRLGALLVALSLLISLCVVPAMAADPVWNPNPVDGAKFKMFGENLSDGSGFFLTAQGSMGATGHKLTSITFVIDYDASKLELNYLDGERLDGIVDVSSLRSGSGALFAHNSISGAWKAIRSTDRYTPSAVYLYLMPEANNRMLLYMTANYGGNLTTDAVGVGEFASVVKIAFTYKSGVTAEELDSSSVKFYDGSLETLKGYKADSVASLNNGDPAYYAYRPTQTWAVTPLGEMMVADVSVSYPGSDKLPAQTFSNVVVGYASNATEINIPALGAADATLQVSATATGSVSGAGVVLPSDAKWTLTASDSSNGTYTALSAEQAEYISIDQATGLISVKPAAPECYVKAVVNSSATIGSDGTLSGALTGTGTALHVKRDNAVATATKVYKGADVIVEDTLHVPAGDTPAQQTYTAKCFDQYGTEMSSSVNWNLTGADSNVSVNGGVVTVTKNAVAKDYTLEATINSIKGSATIHVVKENGYKVTAVAGGEGTGHTVTPGTGVDLAKGGQTAITATPSTGYSFVKWTASVAGGSFGSETTASTTYTTPAAVPGTANSPITLTAAFKANELTFAGSALTSGAVGEVYSQTIPAATNGTGAYTYAVTAGTLPAGLSLSGNTISGTPTAVAESSFTITATDSGSGKTKAADFTLSIAKNPIRGTVSVSGTTTIGEKLTANISSMLPSSATVAYQWVRVETDGTNPQIISGATANEYTLTVDDAGKCLQVEVSGTGEYGGKLTSDKTAAVEKKNGPAAPATVTVDDAANTLDFTVVTGIEDPTAYELTVDGTNWKSVAVKPVIGLTGAYTSTNIKVRVAATADTKAGAEAVASTSFIAGATTVPENLKVTAGTLSLTAAWDKAATEGTSYVAYLYNADGLAIKAEKTENTTVTFSGLDSSITYQVGVSAVLSDVEGDQCALVSGTPNPASSGGGGGSSSSGSTTDKVTNPDGSTTTTVTDKNGTVTETTKYKDGSTSVVKTNKDGSSTETVKMADGSKAEVKTTADGKTTGTVTVTEKAVNEGKVDLPINGVQAGKNSETAPEIAVTLPKGTKANVTVPVNDLKPGTVAVIVHADGTEEIVKTSALNEKGVALTVDGSATVKIVDNSKHFTDVTADNWAVDAVAFVSSRELFVGVTDTTFAVGQNMNRAMLATVLYRLDSGEKVDAASFNDVPADAWFADAVAWAADKGVVTGSGEGGFMPDGNISREALATMLYRYAKASGMDVTSAGSLSGFNDQGSVSDWASNAMAWAVGAGLMNGKGDGVLDPGGDASRGEVATILMRFINNIH